VGEWVFGEGEAGDGKRMNKPAIRIFLEKLVLETGKDDERFGL
jgi:hypothetical protein